MSRRELTTRERAVLDFERNWPAHAGGKLKAITTTFSFSPSRYYQLLAELLERPAAQDYDPLLVRRLRRRRQPQRPQQATLGLTDQRHQRLTK